MKQIIITIVITILSISTIALGVGTFYFYNAYSDAQTKIDTLENKITDLEKEKQEVNTSYNNESSNGNVNTNPSYEENIPNEETSVYSNLQEISFTDLQSLMNNKKSFILLIAKTNCSHCLNYKPILNQVLESNSISAYVIEYDLLTTEEQKELKKICPVDGVPTTTFFKNGVETSASNRIIGEAPAIAIESKLESLGFIE